MRQSSIEDYSHPANKEYLVRAIDWNKVKGQGNGLLSVVVQDARSHTVLMVVYMNEKAYQQTVLTSWLTLFSRKTEELRIQGESRDCCLRIRDLRVSCEGNALLALVDPTGNTEDICHHGGMSCFLEKPDIDDR